MTLRRSAAAASLLVALQLAAGCGGRPVESSGEAAPDRVRVAVLPFLSYAPLFIGADAGLFTAHGLDVELVTLNTTEASAALVRGEVDATANFLSAGIFNLMARGNRVSVVADKGWVDPSRCDANAILARPPLVASGALDQVAGIRGRSIHYRKASAEEYLVNRLLAGSGLEVDDLDGREVPSQARVAALSSGALDLTFWSEPNLTVAEVAGAAVRWREAVEVVPGMQWAVLLFGRSLLDERPEVGVRFVAAYLEAVERYAEGKTAGNVEILARHTGLEPELVERACWLAIRGDGRIDVKSVLAFQRWAFAAGYLDEVVAAEDFWEPRFVDAVGAATGEGG